MSEGEKPAINNDDHEVDEKCSPPNVVVVIFLIINAGFEANFLLLVTDVGRCPL